MPNNGKRIKVKYSVMLDKIYKSGLFEEVYLGNFRMFKLKDDDSKLFCTSMAYEYLVKNGYIKNISTIKQK